MDEQTPYTLFLNAFRNDREGHIDRMKGTGMFEFSAMVKKLQELQHHMSRDTCVGMFGQQLGEHLWEKFVVQHNRNMLSWLTKLTDEYRFFILYESKNNPNYPNYW